MVQAGARSPHAENVSFLALSIEYMVDACARALGSGKPVRLVSDYFGPLRKGALPYWSTLETPLEIPRMCLTMKEVDDDGYASQRIRPALASLVEQTLALVRAASGEESRRDHERREEARHQSDPARMEELRTEIDALEEKRDAAIKGLRAQDEAIAAERESAIEALAAPWNERIEALKERENRIWIDVVRGDKPAPKGFAGAALLARSLVVGEAEAG